MVEKMIEFISANTFAVGQISLSIATAFIAYLVYRSTKRLGKLEQTRFMIEQTQIINKIFLDDKETLDALFKYDVVKNDHTIYKHKRKMIIFMILQLGNAVYNARKGGYIDHDLFDDHFDNLIHRLAADHKEYMLSILETWHTNYGRYLSDQIRNSMK